MDDNELDDRDSLGLSFGEPAAVEFEDSVVAEVFVLRSRFFWATPVEAIVSYENLLG
jgi:hypothetical protein